MTTIAFQGRRNFVFQSTHKPLRKIKTHIAEFIEKKVAHLLKPKHSSIGLLDHRTRCGQTGFNYQPSLKCWQDSPLVCF